MSKIVTFQDNNANFTLTKNLVISDMKLNVSPLTYMRINFVNNVQIFVLSEQVTNELIQNEDVTQKYETREIVNTCKIKWSGYAKYLTYSNIKCDKDCNDIDCNKYVDYKEYIKTKQLKNIPEFRKLVIDDNFDD